MEPLIGRAILISVGGVVRAPLGRPGILRRGRGVECKLYFMEECAESMVRWGASSLFPHVGVEVDVDCVAAKNRDEVGPECLSVVWCGFLRFDCNT